MAKKRDAMTEHLHAATLRIAKFHFVLVALYIIQTVVFHASKVITPQLLMQRWIAATGLTVATILVWLIGRTKHLSNEVYRAALIGIILADTVFAAFNVYTQRGYASKSVLLFLIPIIVAAAFLNRTALFGTALLAAAVYTSTVISYFVLNFNEGYMAEMYAEIALYSGIFIATAYLLWAVIHRHNYK